MRTSVHDALEYAGSGLRQRQKSALAEGQAADGCVLTDSDGELIRRSNFYNRYWDPLRKRLIEKGVPYVRFHDLRHYADPRIMPCSTLAASSVGHARLRHAA